MVGGSLLLITGSALALIFGWLTAESALIWISIIASVVAGVLLALGYQRSKQELRSRQPEAE